MSENVGNATRYLFWVSQTFDSVLTRYLPRHKVRKEKNLLGSDLNEGQEEEEYVSYWLFHLLLTEEF